MPLTARAICDAIARGEITISPFDNAQLNPNSYNLRISAELGVYVPADTPGMSDLVQKSFRFGNPLPKARLDCRKDNALVYVTMPETGALLHPGKLYLGSTIEYTDIPQHVAVIDGRSSLARLGIKAHITGGFGDIGFRGHWTLEIEVTEPVRIYPFMQFAQIRFHVPHGPIDMTYTGKYRDQVRPTACRLYQELADDNNTNARVDKNDDLSGVETP